MTNDHDGERETQFLVRRAACDSCIYRSDSPLDIEKLEADIHDGYGATVGYRICHHHKEACCRGFWNKHAKDVVTTRFALMLGIVKFIDDDEDPNPKVKRDATRRSLKRIKISSD